MTKREEERLNKLLEKKEAEEKANKEFFSQVKKRRSEVLKVLCAPDLDSSYVRLKDIAAKYGCDIPTLLDYIETDRQISYFKKFH